MLDLSQDERFTYPEFDTVHLKNNVSELFFISVNKKRNKW